MTSLLWRCLSHKEDCDAAEFDRQEKERTLKLIHKNFIHSHKLNTRGNTQTLLEALLLLLTSHYLLSCFCSCSLDILGLAPHLFIGEVCQHRTLLDHSSLCLTTTQFYKILGLSTKDLRYFMHAFNLHVFARII